MKTITLMCGLPRSGKSTWVNKNKEESDVIISADDLRLIVYGQRFWSDGESLMWSIRKMMLKYLMQQGKDIVIDETNTTIERRKPLIALAKKYNYYVRVVTMPQNIEKYKERAIETNMTDLIPVIEHMSLNFEYPTLEEGFDQLSEVLTKSE